MRIIVVTLSALLLAAYGFSQNSPISVEEVIQLHKAGLPESLLIARIKEGKPAQISTSELIKLAEAKVPEKVIQTLMAAPAQAPTPAPAPAAARGTSASSASVPADSSDASAQPLPVNSSITVRSAVLAKKDVDAREKELEAASGTKSGGLTGRLTRAVGTAVTGDANRKKAAETVLQQQAHAVVARERQTVIVVIGGKDVLTELQSNLSEVNRPVILLHLDPSVKDKNNENSAIHDGIAGGMTGLATNLWVYLPKSASSADPKPDQMLSSKAPSQRQIWSGIFAADGDAPPEVQRLVK